MMEPITWLGIAQTVAIFATLLFVGYQSFLMRRALEVQSYVSVWTSHINTNHLPIALGTDEEARILNELTPYHGLDLEEARRCHFADAVHDLYECIYRLSEKGVLSEEAARVWRDSVPYEMRNPNLVALWRRHHGADHSESPGTGALGIYHQDYVTMVENSIRLARAAVCTGGAQVGREELDAER